MRLSRAERVGAKPTGRSPLRLVLPALPETAVDISHHVVGFAVLVPALVLPVIATFGETPHRHAFAVARHEHPDDIVMLVPAVRPDDSVGTIGLSAIHDIAAMHKRLAHRSNTALSRT